jgi:tetratricopeptide (TPR) repeat protein
MSVDFCRQFAERQIRPVRQSDCRTRAASGGAIGAAIHRALSFFYNARTTTTWIVAFILFVTGLAPLFVGFTYGAFFLPLYMNACLLQDHKSIEGLTEVMEVYRRLSESMIDLSSYEFYLRNGTCVATLCDGGTPNEKIPACSAIIHNNPRANWAYSNRADAYLRQGQYREVIADETNLIKSDPENAHAYYNRGIAYLEKGDYDEAIADLDMAIAIDPNKNASAYVSRAGYYFNLKCDYDKAIVDLDKAITLDQKKDCNYYYRGLAYGMKGNYDKAIENLDSAIVLSPKTAYYYYKRGVAHLNKSDYDKAIVDFDNAINIDIEPKNRGAYVNRGVAYLNKGDYDRAIASFDRAIEDDFDKAIANYENSGWGGDPRVAMIYYYRGIGYGMKGDYERAIADYTKAIFVPFDPRVARAYYHRGIAYEQLGRRIEAISDYRKSLRLSQLDTDAQAALRRLGADPVEPNAETRTMGDFLGIPTDTRGVNQGAATHDPTDLCPADPWANRFSDLNLSMAAVFHNGIGEITDDYRPQHQFFNDDIVGNIVAELSKYYYTFIGRPFFGEAFTMVLRRQLIYLR